MKKIFTLAIIATVLGTNCSQALAVQNYVHTTTVNENYSATSPSGRFVNYSGTPPQQVVNVVAPNTAGYVPAYNPTYDSAYNQTYAPSYNAAYEVPVYNNAYTAPVYSANAYYNNPQGTNTLAMQDIETPQNYNRTTTTTESYVDTRETADKVIDRSFKVLGGLALVGGAVGLILNAL